MTPSDTRPSEAATQSSSTPPAAAPLPASESKYVAVRVGPQTTSDGCVRIDRAPRPAAHRTGTADWNQP